MVDTPNHLTWSTRFMDLLRLYRDESLLAAPLAVLLLEAKMIANTIGSTAKTSLNRGATANRGEDNGGGRRREDCNRGPFFFASTPAS